MTFSGENINPIENPDNFDPRIIEEVTEEQISPELMAMKQELDYLKDEEIKLKDEQDNGSDRIADIKDIRGRIMALEKKIADTSSEDGENESVN